MTHIFRIIRSPTEGLADDLDQAVVLADVFCGELTELQLELPLDFPEAVRPV